MLFEREEMLCKENDGSTPSGPKDWYGPDGADFKMQKNQKIYLNRGEQIMPKTTYSKGTNEEGVSSPKDEWDLEENPWDREEKIGLRKQPYFQYNRCKRCVWKN